MLWTGEMARHVKRQPYRFSLLRKCLTIMDPKQSTPTYLKTTLWDQRSWGLNFWGISRWSIVKESEDGCRSIAIMYGLIIDPHDDQLPFGLIAQLVGHSALLVWHCIGIVAVRVRVPVLASIFHTFLATAEVVLKAGRIIHVCVRVLNNCEGK